MHREILLRILLTTLFLFPAFDTARALNPEAVYKKAARSVVIVEVLSSGGEQKTATGFFISPGRVATNFHVLKEAKFIWVTPLNQKAKFRVTEVVATDPVEDLAILSVEKAAGVPLKFGSSLLASVGERVYLIGNPEGYTGSFTEGLVSAIRKPGGRAVFQLSIPAARGNSGSPVLNQKGEVIAIVTSRHKEEPSIVFATPSLAIVKLAHDDAGTHKTGNATATAESTNMATEAAPFIEEAGLPIDKQIITIGVPRWPAAKAISHILKATIELKFGHEVKLHRGTHEEIFSGMDKGDGSFDIYPDLWLPNYDRFKERYVEQRKTVVLNHKPYSATQGQCVPGYVRDKYDITNLSDLKEPKFVSLFDSDGNGKGEIWLGQEDWQSTQIERIKARDYGFDNLYEGQVFEEERMWKKLEKAVAVHQPIVFYCYGPHWIFDRFDLVLLKEPPHTVGCIRLIDPEEDAEWYQKSRATCGYQHAKVHLAFSKSLRRRLPKVANFLENFRLTTTLINGWIEALEVKKQDPYLFSKQWAMTHSIVLSEWLSEPGSCEVATC